MVNTITNDLKIKRASRYAWMMFVILLAAYFFVYLHRMSVAVVGRDIVEEVGGNIGYLSSVYFWTYAAMQIPCGMLSDRFGPRKVSFIFLTIAAAGSAVTAFGDTFGFVVIGKMMIAAGMAAVYIPMMKFVATWFPSHYFPQLNGIIIAVGNIGAISATVPLDVAVSNFGWRGTFILLAIITITIAVLCLALLKDRPPDAPAKQNKMGMVEGLKTVFAGGRKFWPMALAYFLVYGSIMVFQGTWSKVYFDSVYGFTVLSVWLVAMIGIGKIVSTVLVGIMAGHKIISSKRIMMLLGNVGFATVWLAVWIFAGKMDSALFWGAVCTLFGFFGGFMTLSFSQVKEWFPVSIAGTSVAAMNVFLFLGASVWTTVAGAIIGTSYTLENFSVVWGIMFVGSLVAVAAVYVSKENKQ